MTRWLYQSEGGGIYFDVGDDIARCLGPRKKLFVGPTYKEQIVKWLATWCGKLNYTTIVDNKIFTPISEEEIKVNLIRFKRAKEIELHIAERPSGAYDVLQTVLVNPYATSKFIVAKSKKSFTISDKLTLQTIQEKLCEIFKQQGYFKTWRPKWTPVSLPSGQAPEPVWDVTYIDPTRFYFVE